MTKQSSISPEIIQVFRKIATASVADALWGLGVVGHMSHEIKPFMKVKIVGPAVTVREEPTTERVPPSHALELIDNSAPGSVIVIAIDGFRDVAVWGGLMTAGAVVNGIEGAVLDGGVGVPASLVEAVLKEAQDIENREREQTRLIYETKSLLKGLEKYQRI